MSWEDIFSLLFPSSEWIVTGGDFFFSMWLDEEEDLLFVSELKNDEDWHSYIQDNDNMVLIVQPTFVDIWLIGITLKNS